MKQFINEIYKKLYKSFRFINDESNYNLYYITNYKFKKYNKFIPIKIVEWIKKNIQYNYSNNLIINQRNIYLNIYSNKKINNIDKYFTKIKLVFYLLLPYANLNCSKNIDIQIYLTPFKKTWNNKDFIHELHVNTGYSTIGCINYSELLLYREEEWFKVLIHELIHNLNLDFTDIFGEKFKNLLKNEFFINSKYDLTESYCEFWARQLNIIINTFLNIKKNDIFSIFYDNYKIALKKEIIFSLEQANKLSAFIYLSNYHEKTNVFCYYVLTSVLMYYSEEFIIWCNNNNYNLINFKKEEKNIIKFIEFIVDKYYNINYYNALKKSTSKTNSMTMTIIS